MPALMQIPMATAMCCVFGRLADAECGNVRALLVLERDDGTR